MKDDRLGLGCICDCFTDLHTEFVSAWEVMQSARRRKSENHFQYLKRLCMENGMEEETFDRFLSYVRYRDAVDQEKLPDKQAFAALYERDIPDRRARIDDYWRLFTEKAVRLRAFQTLS